MAPVLMTRRIIQLLVGLFFYGFAIAMMVRAAVEDEQTDAIGERFVGRGRAGAPPAVEHEVEGASGNEVHGGHFSDIGILS